MAALAGLVASAVVIAGSARSDRPPVVPAAGVPGVPGPPPAFSSGADPRVLVLDGVSGRLEVTAGEGSRATADFVPDGTDVAGRVVFGRADGDGAVPVSCAGEDGPFDACHGLLRLAVPDRTALTIRQSSGEISVSGVAGDLDLSLASVRFTAVGLRAGRVALTVRSGSADVGFAAPPRSVDLASVSASVALRLPSGGPDQDYAFTSDAVSADVRIAVPDLPGSDHRVRLHTESASVAVLAAG